MQDHKNDRITPNPTSTLHSLFLDRVQQSPHKIAYTFWNKISASWQSYTWRDMADKVSQWREAFISENLESGERVALMLPNGPDWICYEQAALSLGLVVVPLYSNDRPDNIAYILEDTASKILLCPGLAYWDHLAPVLDRLHQLKRIITIDDCQAQDKDHRITCITDWLQECQEPAYHYSGSQDELATIVYTSGTTGPPKGVMLSHRNILSNCHAGLESIEIFSSDTFLSFLPLSHMLERTVGYYLPIMAGAMVTFARSIPQLAEDLTLIKPTVLIAVPRIFERIHANIQEQVGSKPPLIRKLFQTAVDIGWRNFLYQQGRVSFHPALLSLPILDLVVAKKIRKKFGGQLRVIVSGGAPLSSQIARVFIGLGLPIYQGYGLTETSPVISVNRPDNNRPEGVGLPLPGVEIKIAENDELLVHGDCVMAGYWKNEKATNDIFTSDGWLKTGDKTELIDGHIKITGRIKEIIILNNSENVAPADMEMAIAMDPLFESTMVVGEGRPYLTLLAVVNKEKMKEVFRSFDILEDSDNLTHPLVLKAVHDRIEAQLTNFPGFAWVKNISLTYEPWTVENGLLTPTLKIKRNTISAKMVTTIEQMYQS